LQARWQFEKVVPELTIASVIFWLIALLTAGSAMFVVTSRNILHAAFSLCMTFLGVGAIYIFLHADFVAAVQLIVYVGGILVLIMFAVMFSSNVVEDTAEHGRSHLAMLAGGASALAIFAAIVLLTQRLAVPLARANPIENAKIAYAHTVSVTGTEIGLGHLLMGQYLLPFEVVSILLLAALIGAVVIVRKELS
jgi:NADH-quinone oxidoreductase subunit J